MTPTEVRYVYKIVYPDGSRGIAIFDRIGAKVFIHPFHYASFTQNENYELLGTLLEWESET